MASFTCCCEIIGRSMGNWVLSEYQLFVDRFRLVYDLVKTEVEGQISMQLGGLRILSKLHISKQ